MRASRRRRRGTTFLDGSRRRSTPPALPAYSIGGADGWTLTDLFENIYIQTAGPETYDKLAAHEIPWTDQSVKDALTEMAKIVGDTDNIAGGQAGALPDGLPDFGRKRLLGDAESRRGARGRLRPWRGR